MTVTSSGESFSTLGAFLEVYRPRIGGRHGGADARIVQWINAGVQEVARVLPPEFLIATFSITVASGTTAYDLDSASVLYKDLMQGTVKLTDSASNVTRPLYVQPHLWEPLKVLDDGDADAAQYFTVLPQTLSARRRIELYDTPDATYTLTGQYLYKPGRLQIGQDATGVPIPVEGQPVLEYYMDWRVEEANHISAGDIDRARDVYESKRLELSHDLHKSSVGKDGHVEAQTPDYVVGATDYQNL